MIKHELTKNQSHMLYYNQECGLSTFRDYCMTAFRGKFRYSQDHGFILFENENDYTMFLLRL